MGNTFVHRVVVAGAVVLSLLGAVASPAPAGAGSDPVAALTHLVGF